MSLVQPDYASSPITGPTCHTIYTPAQGGTGPGALAPLYGYLHSDPGGDYGSAIVGGPRYMGTSNYPSSYVGKVFIGDYARSRIQTVDLSTGVATDFGTAGTWGNPVDMQIAPDGNVVFLAFGPGERRPRRSEWVRGRWLAVRSRRHEDPHVLRSRDRTAGGRRSRRPSRIPHVVIDDFLVGDPSEALRFPGARLVGMAPLRGQRVPAREDDLRRHRADPRRVRAAHPRDVRPVVPARCWSASPASRSSSPTRTSTVAGCTRAARAACSSRTPTSTTTSGSDCSAGSTCSCTSTPTGRPTTAARSRCGATPTATKVVRSVVPSFGTCVIFQTDFDSVHGFTEPVKGPRYRNSIALYYYTAAEAGKYSGDTTTYWRQHEKRTGIAGLRMRAYRGAAVLRAAIAYVAHRVESEPHEGPDEAARPLSPSQPRPTTATGARRRQSLRAALPARSRATSRAWSRAFAAQQYPDLEVVMVDDASPGLDAAALDALLAPLRDRADERAAAAFVVAQRRAISAWSATGTTRCAAGSGELTMCVSQDDELGPGMLAAYVAEFVGRPDGRARVGRRGVHRRRRPAARRAGSTSGTATTCSSHRRPLRARSRRAGAPVVAQRAGLRRAVGGDVPPVGVRRDRRLRPVVRARGRRRLQPAGLGARPLACTCAIRICAGVGTPGGLTRDEPRFGRGRARPAAALRALPRTPRVSPIAIAPRPARRSRRIRCTTPCARPGRGSGTSPALALDNLRVGAQGAACASTRRTSPRSSATATATSASGYNASHDGQSDRSISGKSARSRVRSPTSVSTNASRTRTLGLVARARASRSAPYCEQRGRRLEVVEAEERERAARARRADRGGSARTGARAAPSRSKWLSMRRELLAVRALARRRAR